MHKLVALGKLDPTFQKIATWIRAQVPTDRRGSTAETADAVFNWVQQHGIFQRDPFQIEKIENPIEAMRPIIQARQAGTYTGPGLFVGDCDTFAIVTATLGGILGFQYAFETAKVDPSRPDEFSHVWTSLLVGNDWRALDSSTQGAYPGWRPPVDANLFKRWPEKPIESIVGKSDMSAINGGLLGEFGGDNTSPMADVDAQYPADYVGYGIPKDFGTGPGVIPEANFADLQPLVPHDTQIPSADLEPDMHMLKAAPIVEPAERVRRIDGQPDDHGNPYYKTTPGHPYIKVNNQPYPPGSRWNGQIGVDTVRYVRPGPYIRVKSAESPERQVRVDMAQPMLARRRTVLVTPRRMPFGTMEGMGDDGDTSGIVTSLDTPFSSTAPTEEQVTQAQIDAQANAAPTRNAVAPSVPSPIITSLSQDPTTGKTVAPTGAASTPQQKQAAAAGSSVWDAISSVFSAAGKVAPAVMQTSLMQSVIGATNKLAGKNVVGAANVTPWYTNPFVLGAGLIVVGGGTYIAMKSRPGSSGRRRR